MTVATFSDLPGACSRRVVPYYCTCCMPKASMSLGPALVFGTDSISFSPRVRRPGMHALLGISPELSTQYKRCSNLTSYIHRGIKNKKQNADRRVAWLGECGVCNLFLVILVLAGCPRTTAQQMHTSALQGVSCFVVFPFLGTCPCRWQPGFDLKGASRWGPSHRLKV